MIAFVFGVFGLIVGSFLNVLVLRWGKQPITGRSACSSCNTQIVWYDNIPLLSWVLLHGRCRHCDAAISLQYPLVETTTAFLFAFIGGSSLPILDRLFALPIAALLMAIAVYDLRTTYIPDAWVYLFLVLALAPALAFTPYSMLSIPYILLSGPAAALLLFAIWLISKGRWMGFGDVKLALGIGYLLGPLSGFIAVMLAFVLGAIVSLTILLPLPYLARTLQCWGIARVSSLRSYTMKSEVPFGPFLVAATLIVWISQMYNLDLSSMLLGLSR